MAGNPFSIESRVAGHDTTLAVHTEQLKTLAEDGRELKEELHELRQEMGKLRHTIVAATVTTTLSAVGVIIALTEALGR